MIPSLSIYLLNIFTFLPLDKMVAPERGYIPSQGGTGLGAQHEGEAQGLGRKGPEVLLTYITYINACDHILTPRPLIEAGAHTLGPIPAASILADRDLVLALISSKARAAFADLSIPCPSVVAWD